MKQLYDENYFFHECEGYKDFLSSGGIKLSRRLSYIYSKIYAKKPQKILDMGCGRGELAMALAIARCQVSGVDSSIDSIKISSALKERWIRKYPQMKLDYFNCDASSLPFEDNTFDVVIMSDLVEHLKDEILLAAFFEAFRVLKKNGTLFIHTSPNKIFINFGLSIYKLLGFLSGIKMPRDMRAALPAGLGKQYHVNEQTVFSLRKNLSKTGFSSVTFEFKKNPHYVYYFLKKDKYIKILNRIYRFFPLKHVFFADIFVEAVK